MSAWPSIFIHPLSHYSSFTRSRAVANRPCSILYCHAYLLSSPSSQGCKDAFNSCWSFRACLYMPKGTAAPPFKTCIWYPPCAVRLRIENGSQTCVLSWSRANWMGFDARCDLKPFVINPVSPSIFELLNEFKDEFDHNPHLRIHVDYNENDNIIVYDYFKSDLLTLLENYPALSIEARKIILKEVGLGLREIHTKNWIHLGMVLSRFTLPMVLR